MATKRTLLSVYPVNMEKLDIYRKLTGQISMTATLNAALAAFFSGQSHAKLDVPALAQNQVSLGKTKPLTQREKAEREEDAQRAYDREKYLGGNAKPVQPVSGPVAIREDAGTGAKMVAELDDWKT